VVPAAWLLGGFFGLAIHGGVSPVLTSISFVLLGGLVAADARLPLAGSWIAAVGLLWAPRPVPEARGLAYVILSGSTR
jgi:hypothetical protein